MSTKTYAEMMAAMGIDRGALDDGFPCEDGTCTLANREPSLVNRQASMKVRAATMGLVVEDFAHLNPSFSQAVARGVSERARLRRISREGTKA